MGKIAHKLAWWQIWVVLLAALLSVATVQMRAASDQGKRDATQYEAMVEAGNAASAERPDKQYKAYFAEHAAGGFYAAEANILRIYKKHWQYKTVWQYLYWRRFVVLGIVLEVIGMSKCRKRKRELEAAMNDNPGMGKRFHPDVPFGRRGFVLAIMAVAISPVTTIFVKKHNAWVLLGIWLIGLLCESIRYKIRGGKLDFGGVPEGVANAGGWLQRVWKKRRKAKARRKKHKSWWDKLRFRWGIGK